MPCVRATFYSILTNLYYDYTLSGPGGSVRLTQREVSNWVSNYQSQSRYGFLIHLIVRPGLHILMWQLSGTDIRNGSNSLLERSVMSLLNWIIKQLQLGRIYFCSRYFRRSELRVIIWGELRQYRSWKGKSGGEEGLKKKKTNLKLKFFPVGTSTAAKLAVVTVVRNLTVIDLLLHWQLWRLGR